MKEFKKEIFAFILLVTGLLIDFVFGGFNALFGNAGATVRFSWYFIAALPVGWPIVKEMIEALKEGEIFNEFFLMTTAAVCAFVIGEYPEGLAVLLFYTIGENLQDKAVSKAQDNISSLLDIRPETTTVIRNNAPVVVPTKQVKIGEVLIVKVGERIPIDGELLEKAATLDTAALTGESVPRLIEVGEPVLSGMTACDGEIKLRTNKLLKDSALSRILEMVNNAKERKSTTELFVHKFAHIYTSVVIYAALALSVLPLLLYGVGLYEGYAWQTGLGRSAVFMVVSCPCALVISIPLGYFGGIGTASKNGILVKGGNYLDAIAKIDAVAFDKTGTLTQGKFQVKKAIAAAPYNEADLLRVIYAAESHSNHPIAKAICRYAQKENVEKGEAGDLKELAGRGMIAQLNGQQILVGNLKLLKEEEVEMDQPTDEDSHQIYCAIDHHYAGCLLLEDEPKADCAQAIASLYQLGIKKIEIYSGDNQHNVDLLAREIKVDKAYGDLLPEGKVKKIEELKKGHSIAFVGDGINDAPVLALADVGIAMGGMGSDVAIETADVVIEDDRPGKLATGIRIARRTRTIVWQNILFALGVKVSVMALSFLLSDSRIALWLGVFADSGVALIAVMNAIRIQYEKFN